MTRSTLTLILSRAALLGAPTLPVHADPIPLSNTGVPAAYTLISSPSGPQNAVVFANLPVYVIPNDATSQWITPEGPFNDAGDYVYRTTFDLTGLDPSTADIDGLWCTDNNGVDILINGQSTGYTTSSVQFFIGFEPFTINTGFVAGVNTLDFVVHELHAGSPTALNVRLTGRATADGDTTPPEVACSVATAALWPPDHSLINVGLEINVSDDRDPNPRHTVTIYGDEDDEEDAGDGVHAADAKDIGAGALRLRSEREGDGDGRVYLIVVTATDASGNVGVACCAVVVQHGRNRPAIEAVNQQAAAAIEFCEANGGDPPPGYFLIGDGAVLGPKQSGQPGTE